MSHDLDFSTGDAAFAQFGDRVTAWHRYGVAVGQMDGLTVREKIALVMEKARLDWTVEPFDIFDVHGRFIPGWKSFERSDTNYRMGIFPETYTVVQNHELLELVEPLIDAGIFNFNTAGALRMGESVWVQFGFNLGDDSVREWYEANGIKPYALLSNNHSRKQKLTIMETAVNVVCANTLGAALGTFGRARAGRYPGAVLLRHTKNIRSLSVDAVQSMWGNITDRFGKMAESYEALKARYLTEEEFSTNVLDILAPIPTPPDGGGDGRFDAALARSAERRGLVRTLYNGGGRGIDGEPTAWNAYMATTEALDHFDGQFKVRTDRLQALVPGGSLANKKQDVLNALASLGVS
jgi:phage/plasmid-like protein (TIGR03299 family)